MIPPVLCQLNYFVARRTELRKTRIHVWSTLLVQIFIVGSIRTCGAEVMDKEPTLAEIWSAIPIWAFFAFVVAAYRPLFGCLVLLAYFISSGPAVIAFTELQDSYVGRAIREEAGLGYVVQTYAANFSVAAGFLGGCSLRLLLRRHKRARPKSC